MKKGDKIYLYDNENEYEYAVTGVSEVTPDKWEVVEDHGKDEITLITCVSVKDNSKRYVVAGDLVRTRRRSKKEGELFKEFTFFTNVEK